MRRRCVVCAEEFYDPKYNTYKGEPVCRNCFDLTNRSWRYKD